MEADPCRARSYSRREQPTHTRNRCHDGGRAGDVGGAPEVAAVARVAPASRAVAVLRWIGVLLFAILTPASAFAQFSITRVSSPTFYEDAGLTGMYVGYEIKNTSATTYPDIWVDIGNFTGGFVSLAQYEDGVAHLGAMAPGDVKMAYF